MRALVIVGGLLLLGAPAGGQPLFQPAAGLDLETLTRLVQARTPVLAEALLASDLARAELRQSRLVENPQLDFGWNTIPVGQTTPADLPSPLGEVPSYSVGLSYRLLLGKRGPRIARARALVDGADAQRAAAARGYAFELARVLGTLAVARLRSEGVGGLLEEGRRAVELARIRVKGGAGTPLEVDRLENELSRNEQQILAAEGEIDVALAACAGLLGQRCDRFASSDEARRFLAAWVARAGRAASLPAPEGAERPDVRALAALQRAADAEVRWARAQAIPDPTLRLGYTHDRFVISGNQQNSLNLSLTLPLPIFDHGQALVQAGRARQARLLEERLRLQAAAEARIPALRVALETQARRRARLANEMIPRAQAVLRDLTRAAESRLIPLGDVIQARRALHELLLAEADSQGDAFAASLDLLAQLPPEMR